MSPLDIRTTRQPEKMPDGHGRFYKSGPWQKWVCSAVKWESTHRHKEEVEVLGEELEVMALMLGQNEELERKESKGLDEWNKGQVCKLDHKKERGCEGASKEKPSNQSHIIDK